uniref:Calcineurin-like phosphoesterase domain-containing protein n=1 Tax=Meloidogyne incognita TaxID=6306 RepID=A0A914MTP2_MELIC
MFGLDPIPELQANNPSNLWMEYSKERVCNEAKTLPLNEPIHPDRVRFVCISDTHNHLDQILHCIPPGDVLLHCGDFTNFGDLDELEKFSKELKQLPHRYKIVIAGNHELGFEDGEDISGRRANANMWRLGSGSRGTHQGYKQLTDCIYLQDSSVKIYGINIFGSSWHPLPGFSFYRSRGKAIFEEWLKIPHAKILGEKYKPVVDVLMTHSPPLGHSDLPPRGDRMGDADLLNVVEKAVKPRVHVFGHTHEPKPVATTNGETLFINAAICSDKNTPLNNPVLFDLPLPEGEKKE